MASAKWSAITPGHTAPHWLIQFVSVLFDGKVFIVVILWILFYKLYWLLMFGYDFLTFSPSPQHIASKRIVHQILIQFIQLPIAPSTPFSSIVISQRESINSARQERKLYNITSNTKRQHPPAPIIINKLNKNTNPTRKQNTKRLTSAKVAAQHFSVLCVMKHGASWPAVSNTTYNIRYRNRHIITITGCTNDGKTPPSPMTSSFDGLSMRIADSEWMAARLWL